MYEMKCRIRYSEITESGELTMTGLINLLQDCATLHSHDAGYNGLDLSKDGKGWFVTDYQVHIRRLPQMGEHVTVQTFPYAFRGMMGSRHFKVFGDDGELLFTANSLWVFMDIVRQRPIRVPDTMKETYGIENAPEEDFGSRKIPMPKDMERTSSFVVSPAHLDVNHHMNNGKYIEVVQSLLPADRSIKAFRIEYKKQAIEGDEIGLMTCMDGDKFFVSMERSDEVLCTMEFCL